MGRKQVHVIHSAGRREQKLDPNTKTCLDPPAITMPRLFISYC